MIEETAIFLNKANPKDKDYLLLATKGTYKSEIYKKTFKKFGLNILEPSQSDQDIIMGWTNKIKSSKFDITLEEYEYIIDKYRKDKNTPVILGCTELPLLASSIGLMEEEYIDPTLVLAKCCVELSGKSLLKI